MDCKVCLHPCVSERVRSQKRQTGLLDLTGAFVGAAIIRMRQ